MCLSGWSPIRDRERKHKPICTRHLAHGHTLLLQMMLFWKPKYAQGPSFTALTLLWVTLASVFCPRHNYTQPASRTLWAKKEEGTMKCCFTKTLVENYCDLPLKYPPPSHCQTCWYRTSSKGKWGKYGSKSNIKCIRQAGAWDIPGIFKWELAASWLTTQKSLSSLLLTDGNKHHHGLERNRLIQSRHGLHKTHNSPMASYNMLK